MAGLGKLVKQAQKMQRGIEAVRWLFIATSGHEWVDAGAEIFHKSHAPEPADTALWFHLGASFAARHSAHDVDTRDDRAEVVRCPADECEDGARAERQDAPAPVEEPFVRVRAERVLSLANAGVRPRGVPVPASAEHPAGLRLSGVSSLGVGLEDGDVLTRVGGIDLCVSEFIRVTGTLLPERAFRRVLPELDQGGRTPAGVPVTSTSLAAPRTAGPSAIQ